MVDFQCTIDTLNRATLTELRDYLARAGIEPTVYTTIRYSIPLYLIRAKNEYSYVCTRAQAHFLLKGIPVAHTERNDEAFRVFPDIRVTAHKEKGAFATVQYIDIGKDRQSDVEFSLSTFPI